MNSESYDDEFFENIKFKKILAIEDYSLNQDGIIYKIVLREYENFINIKYNKYELDLNLNDFNSQIHSHYTSIEQCFNYLSSKFSENNAYIKTIKKEYNLGNMQTANAENPAEDNLAHLTRSFLSE